MARIIFIVFKFVLKKYNDVNKRRKLSWSSWEYNMPSALIQYNFSPIPRCMTHISLSLNCSKLFFFVYMSFLYVRITLSSQYPWNSLHSVKKQNFYFSETDLYLSCPYTLYILTSFCCHEFSKIIQSHIFATVKNKTRFCIIYILDTWTYYTYLNVFHRNYIFWRVC